MISFWQFLAVCHRVLPSLLIQLDWGGSRFERVKLVVMKLEWICHVWQIQRFGGLLCATRSQGISRNLEQRYTKQEDAFWFEEMNFWMGGLRWSNYLFFSNLLQYIGGHNFSAAKKIHPSCVTDRRSQWFPSYDTYPFPPKKTHDWLENPPWMMLCPIGSMYCMVYLPTFGWFFW